MNDALLPYIPASPETKQKHEDTMRAANVPLHAYHEQVRLKGHKVTRRQFCNMIVESAKGQPKSVVVHDVAISQEAVEKILALRTIEYEILCAYSKLFAKEANRWCDNSFVSVSFDDLYDECIFAALNSIVGFRKEEIKFCTYLTSAVNRRLSRVVMAANPLSVPSPDGVELVNRFYEKRQSLNRSASFDEICSLLEFTNEQVALLRTMMVTVINHTALEVNDRSSENDDRIGNDYAALGNVHCGLDGKTAWNRVGVGNSASYRERTTLDPDMVAAIESANLSELERAVLEGFTANAFASDHRSQGLGDIAKNLVNPQTGKPYSRMALTFALRRAKEKILVAYGQREHHTVAATTTETSDEEDVCEAA